MIQLKSPEYLKCAFCLDVISFHSYFLFCSEIQSIMQRHGFFPATKVRYILSMAVGTQQGHFNIETSGWNMVLKKKQFNLVYFLPTLATNS